MVFLEDARKKRRGADGVVLKQRRDVWRALDKKLAELGGKNAEAFSELMMDQEVVLDDVSKAELEEFAGAADGVVKDLRRESEKGHADETIAAGLLYEYEEMRALSKNLRKRRDRLARKQ